MPWRNAYRILLVEDNEADAYLTQASLKDDVSGDTYSLVHVSSFAACMRELEHGHFDVVLLDLMLPDRRGLEGVTELGEHHPEMPILVLSGLDDERLALEAVLIGAQDYLIKGEGDGRLLRRAIRHAIERKRAEWRLARLATHDCLTGLPNRTLFEDRLHAALNRAERRGQLVAMIYIDLDGFKGVNDQHGHASGDAVLQETARRLTGTVRRTDTVARLGGDEFVVLLEAVRNEGDVAGVADKLLAELARPFLLRETRVLIGASLGIALAVAGSDTPGLLTERADGAMYTAKAGGGLSYTFALPETTALSA